MGARALMKTRVKTQFICQVCGVSSPKWYGQCGSCGKWNTLIEEVAEALNQSSFKKSSASKFPVPLDASELVTDSMRWSTGLKELDQVLGGGLVPGSYILLGGAPGIGKSTLLLQMSEGVASKGKPVFYVSAEESASQTRLRASRLALKNTGIFIANETSLEQIFHHAEKLRPKVLVIDSIQTVQLSGLGSAAGTISQVKECAGQLMNFAKNTQTTVFVIGHITKEGNLAGPRILEHIVDTVLSFDGDPHYHFRILRAIKNRFGASNEIGVFQMSSQGLLGEANPSKFFLEERGENSIGSVVFTAMEGSRPLLCEVQALVIKSYLSMPRRTAIGIDTNRLNMILAVLDRYLKVGFYQYDVFVSIAGGLKITEPAMDLAIAQALLSAKTEKVLSATSCFFGEISLTGQIRATTFCEERIKEARKLGFQSVYLPKGNKNKLPKTTHKNISLHGMQKVQDLHTSIKGVVIVEYALLLVTCVALALLFANMVVLGGSPDEHGFIVKKWFSVIKIIAEDI